MNISYNTIELNRKTSNGYGYAGSHIVSSLKSLDNLVEIDNPNSDIQLFFSQPEYMRFRPNKLNIAYTPWESTKTKRGWVAKFNQADEVWTTSDTIAQWYLDSGVTRPLFVYEHGIEKLWKPVKRNNDRPIRFLHIGEPAPRKGGQMVLEAFLTAFLGDRNAHLTIKAHGVNTTRIYENDRRPEIIRSILGTPDIYPNISVITEELSTLELVSLYWDHDIMIYPSWGEGFGFIPLQALATGMPTICTGGWAPYRDFLGPLELKSRLVDSPWPDIHPGQMFEPDKDHLVSLMKTAAENFIEFSELYHSQALAVHDAYDWERLTRDAFAHLENT
jgi:glycosyltransferase involved in cell wall biosynthesis